MILKKPSVDALISLNKKEFILALRDIVFTDILGNEE